MVKQTLISVAIALTAFGSAARAADLAPLYAQPDDSDTLPPPDLTFGTGWYLRGDLTATDDSRVNTLGTLDGRSKTSRDWNYGVGGGAGYKFNNYFRADITGDYLGPQKTMETDYDSYGALSVKSNLRRFDGLVNGYFDLGTWAGLTPYIGAGVGFAGVRLDGSYEATGPGYGYEYSKISGKTTYDLAWAAMAGLTYNLSQNLLIDVGYRYLDLGTYKIPRFAQSPFNEGLKTDLTSHQVRLGLRYMIY